MVLTNWYDTSNEDGNPLSGHQPLLWLTPPLFHAQAPVSTTWSTSIGRRTFARLVRTRWAQGADSVIRIGTVVAFAVVGVITYAVYWLPRDVSVDSNGVVKSSVRNVSQEKNFICVNNCTLQFEWNHGNLKSNCSWKQFHVFMNASTKVTAPIYRVLWHHSEQLEEQNFLKTRHCRNSNLRIGRTTSDYWSENNEWRLEWKQRVKIGVKTTSDYLSETQCDVNLVTGKLQLFASGKDNSTGNTVRVSLCPKYNTIKYRSLV